MLGRLTRKHSFPKNGYQWWKLELFNPGGVVFQNRREFWIRADDEAEPVEIKTDQDPKPSGGVWGQAAMVIIPIPESIDSANVLRGWQVGLWRGELPQLDDDEVYLVDLVGRSVVDENSERWGRVMQVFDHRGSLTVELERASGELMEFPFEWIDKDSLDAVGPLVVPGISAWTKESLSQLPDDQLPNDQLPDDQLPDDQSRDSGDT